MASYKYSHYPDKDPPCNPASICSALGHCTGPIHRARLGDLWLGTAYCTPASFHVPRSFSSRCSDYISTKAKFNCDAPVSLCGNSMGQGVTLGCRLRGKVLYHQFHFIYSSLIAASPLQAASLGSRAYPRKYRTQGRGQSGWGTRIPFPPKLYHTSWKRGKPPLKSTMGVGNLHFLFAI